MKIKICGLQRAADVDAALALGVDAIGLNLWPGSKRVVSLEHALVLCAQIGARAQRVAVLVDPKPAFVRELVATGAFDRLQLHGDENLDAFDDVPRAQLWKAVRLANTRDVDAALALRVDALLIDVPGPELGGSGRSADWRLAQTLAAQRPVWLAGGLRADNVALAIATVAPFGVDVASGVETSPGIKDHDKLHAFVRAARGQAS